MKTILQGVVGSTAYGIAGPESDIDRLGVHVGPIYDVMTFGLSKSQQSVVTTDPDSTSHDVAKYLSLILGGNPTVTELLWLSAYDVCTEAGMKLVTNRKHFLGAKAVRDSYGGYAMQQIQRLMKRGGSFSSDTDKRKPKHSRHCLRLLIQGSDLLRTGELNIELTDLDKDVLWQASEYAETEKWDLLEGLYYQYNHALNMAYDATVLSPQPDRLIAKSVLYDIRCDQLIDGP